MLWIASIVAKYYLHRPICIEVHTYPRYFSGHQRPIHITDCWLHCQRKLGAFSEYACFPHLGGHSWRPTSRHAFAAVGGLQTYLGGLIKKYFC
jgi:hypothetical protein